MGGSSNLVYPEVLLQKNSFKTSVHFPGERSWGWPVGVAWWQTDWKTNLMSERVRHRSTLGGGGEEWWWIIMCPFYSCVLCTKIWQLPVQHVVASVRENWLNYFINTTLRNNCCREVILKKEKSHFEKQSHVEWHSNCYTYGTLKTVIYLNLRQKHRHII